MFTRKPKDNAHPLDETITVLISEFAGADSGSEEQKRLAETVKLLMETRAADKAAASSSLSPDMVASITAHLLGIGMILVFESRGIITSKSLSFVPKMK